MLRFSDLQPQNLKYDTSEEQLEEGNTNLNVSKSDTEEDAHSPKLQDEIILQSHYDQCSDTQEWKRNAREKNSNRDDIFALNKENENIDDDDNNKNDINTIKTVQRRLENL